MEINSEEYQLIKALADAVSEFPAKASLERLEEWRTSVIEAARVQPINIGSTLHASNCTTHK
ncbi:MAG: hypothetical protein QOJ99_122 [Bryobacterales bacterium]|jgi:hypothetical protein|nr:hypothetical protein [Bryobacterales bacterium]